MFKYLDRAYHYHRVTRAVIMQGILTRAEINSGALDSIVATYRGGYFILSLEGMARQISAKLSMDELLKFVDTTKPPFNIASEDLYFFAQALVDSADPSDPDQLKGLIRAMPPTYQPYLTRRMTEDVA